MHRGPTPSGTLIRRMTTVALATLLLLGTPVGAQDDTEDQREVGADDALAQPNSAFAVSPGTDGERPDRSAITLEVLPGQTIQDEISIFNFTDAPISFRIWSGDGYNTADGAYAIYGEDVEATDTGSWIELPDTEVTVAPTSRADLPILIRVPTNAEPGDHAGGVAAVNTTPVESVDAGGAAVDVLRAVGTRIYLRVAGPLEPALEVRNIEVSSSQPLFPGLTGSGDATLTYEIVNTGNLRLTPTATARVSGPFGLGERRAEPVEFRELLPGSSVVVTQDFVDVPALGRMSAEIRLTSVDVDTVRTATFWAIPWTYLVALAILAGGVWWRRRRPSTDDGPPAEEWIEDEHEPTPLVSA